ncbi:MAG: DEAD/DEAH box helicase [Geminicoccaceae bacterium]
MRTSLLPLGAKDIYVNDLRFSDLGLAEPILQALSAKNYTTPTPIQRQAIPELLKGKDVLGIAQTGTGKTAAFALPIIHQLSGQRGPRDQSTPRDRRDLRGPRALILAPTRELAGQIADEMRAYGRQLRLRQTVIFGGVGQKGQVNALNRGVDIVIATPGRLLDLMEQGFLKLQAIEFLVLDEADRMLDMGFIRDIRKIVAAMPKERQSLLFSATMPGDIVKLSGDMLSDPVRVEIKPQSTPIERIEQSVYHVDTAGKRGLLTKLLSDQALSRVIVFSRTKHRANRIVEQLDRSGISADAIHGNKSQGARQRALARFRSGQARVLVATDIAARGIDVDGVTHVINYELPNEPESYVHRIGRTARAGAGGAALSFCDSTERAYLKDIEKLIRSDLTVIGDGPVGKAESPTRRRQKSRDSNGGGQGGNKGGGKPWQKRSRSRGKPATKGSHRQHQAA